MSKSLWRVSTKKARMARWMACHLVEPVPVGSSIEPELSSMTLSATRRRSAAAVCERQASSSWSSSSEPPDEASSRSRKFAACVESLPVTSTLTGSLLHDQPPTMKAPRVAAGRRRR